jgi:hypothetical protein
MNYSPLILKIGNDFKTTDTTETPWLGYLPEVSPEARSLRPRLERVTTAMAMPVGDPYSTDFTLMTFGGQVTSQFRHSMHISSSIVISPFWGGKSNFSNCMGHSSMHREQPFWKCKH